MSDVSILKTSEPCAKRINIASAGSLSVTTTSMAALFDHSYEAVGSFAELAEFLEELQNNPYGFIVRVGQTSKLKQVMDEEFEAATGVKAGIKMKLLELSDDRKQIVKELIDDELSGFSTRLNKWRKKHHWKFFVDGGTASDVPQLTAR